MADTPYQDSDGRAHRRGHGARHHRDESYKEVDGRCHHVSTPANNKDGGRGHLHDMALDMPLEIVKHPKHPAHRVGEGIVHRGNRDYKEGKHRGTPDAD